MENEFDPITQVLKEFIVANGSELEEQSKLIQEKVYESINFENKNQLSRDKGYKILADCRKKALALMKQKCSKNSIDFWLSCVRRLPGIVTWWGNNWVPYSTLGILKWSNWEPNSSTKPVKLPGGYGLSYDAVEEDVFDCCAIASIGRLIATINDCSRWIGKGAILKRGEDKKFEIDIPSDVKASVDWYEARRPLNPFFADEGIHISETSPLEKGSTDKFLYFLGTRRPTANKVVLSKNKKQYPITYFLYPFSIKDIRRALLPYDEAIEDIFGINVESLLNILQSVSKLIVSSVPPPDNVKKEIIFNSDPADENFIHKFSFLMGLCTKGFIRFPKKYFKECIFTIDAPFYREQHKTISFVESFFHHLCFDKKNCSNIDVARLEPFPIFYTSPSGQCYFDALWFPDFIRWIINRSQEWFSSQHGDRFTLALKKHIERDVKNISVISKRTFQNKNGAKVEVDLLIQKEDTLYAVECKAFSKKRDFWAGEPIAVSRRTAKIKKAVDQAIKAANFISVIKDDLDFNYKNIKCVEWVLCLPTQEFLKPLDKFGLLNKNIPKVCTPDELVAFLHE